MDETKAEEAPRKFPLRFEVTLLADDGEHVIHSRAGDYIRAMKVMESIADSATINQDILFPYAVAYCALRRLGRMGEHCLPESITCEDDLIAVADTFDVSLEADDAPLAGLQPRG